MNSQTIAERIAGTPGSWNDAPLCKRLAGLLQEEAGMGAGKDDETGDGFPEWHRQPPTHTAIRHSER